MLYTVGSNNQIPMTKATITLEDGSTVDLFDQSYTDDAVQQALANAGGSTLPVVAPEDVEVDIILTDGTTKKFVPAA